jgi:phospholipid transport system substrate-binding protein
MSGKTILAGLVLTFGAIGLAPEVGAAEPAAAVLSPAAAPPVAVIERLHAALLDTMRQGAAVSGEARYRALAPVIDRTFNLPLMTEVAVGPRWSSLSAAQRDKLIAAFRRFTIANYVSHFDSYNGQRFEIAPAPRPIAGGQMVLSQLVPSGRQPVALNYVLRQTDGVWQAIDVYADGTISELARRRSEFNDLLNSAGADGLADRLVERAQSLIKQPA